MREKIQDLPAAVCALIGINLLVFVILEIGGSTEDGYYMMMHGALEDTLVLQEGEYYRLLTAAFLHFGVSHLMNNMLLLYVIGMRLERVVGSVRFLIIYLVSAVGANACSLAADSIMDTEVLSAGASGAIFGVIGALFAVMLRRHRGVQGVDRRQMMFLIAVSLYSGFVSESTNNTAHISGLAFGFLLGWIMGKDGCGRR